MGGTVRPRLTSVEGRRFAFTLGGAFLVLSAVLWWRNRMGASTLTGSLAALFLAAGGLVPAKLGPIHHAWMSLGHALSRITTPIFMAVVYFLVLVPVGLAMRAIGRNPLSRTAIKGSFWVARTEAEQRTDIARQF